MKQSEELTEEQAQELFFAGLQRLYAEYRHDEAAAAADGNDATDQELKRTLQTGTRKEKEQTKRLLVVFEAVNLRPAVDEPKGTEKSLLAEGRKNVADATDALARDLAIIAAEQLSAQAYIAELGTLHTYARLMKNAPVARHLHRMMNDTKQLEETVTKLAIRLVKQSMAHPAAVAPEEDAHTPVEAQEPV